MKTKPQCCWQHDNPARCPNESTIKQGDFWFCDNHAGDRAKNKKSVPSIVTPPQPAHGEPWRVYEYNCNTSVVNAAGDEVAVFDSDKDADCAIECVNKLMLHPDLSAVEVHSKETMDEVRAVLKAILPFITRLREPRYDTDETNDYVCGSSDCHDAIKAISLAESALAKLNPPQ